VAVRPILMTTDGALLGGASRDEDGDGVGLRRPLGISMIGRMIFARGADALYDAGCILVERLGRSVETVGGEQSRGRPSDDGGDL